MESYFKYFSLRILFLSVGSLMLTGCFETDFNFKTIVQSDGSIYRETKIDGRGAKLFIPPAGASWQVKKYETRGGQSLLDDKYYHIYATGKFKNADQIGSDYQYDSVKAFEEISDEERKNFIELGFVEPFEESIYSKNNVQLIKKRGLFTSVYEYQEVFQNRGIIELLLNDLKKEIVRDKGVEISKTSSTEPVKSKIQASPVTEVSQAAETLQEGHESPSTDTLPSSAPVTEKAQETVLPVPSVTIEGQMLAPKKVEELARERLIKEILPHFKFHSEVTMPGKLLSSNATRVVGNTAVWDFSVLDFSNLSQYVITVESKVIEWKLIILILVVLILILFGVSAGLTRSQNHKSQKRR